MTEHKIALENARERVDSRGAQCHPDRLPIEWMRYAEADACIADGAASYQHPLGEKLPWMSTNARDCRK